MKKNNNKKILKNIIIFLLTEMLLLILLFNVIRKKIKYKELIYNLYIKIIVLSLIIVLIQYLIAIIKSKNKISVNINEYLIKIIILFTFIIINFSLIKLLMYIYPKKSVIDLFKYDLMQLEKFVKDNKEIKTKKELYEKTKNLLKSLSFTNNDFKLDNNFLYTYMNRPNIVYYYLAKYPDDCSYFEHFTINMNLQNKFPIITIKDKNINNKFESIKFIKEIIENSCKNKKYIFFSIGIQYDKDYIKTCTENSSLKDKIEDGYHAIIIILDKNLKTVEYFDSNLKQKLGSKKVSKYTFNDCDEIRINNLFSDYFEGYTQNNDYFDDESIEKLGTFCFQSNDKIIGLQSLDNNHKSENLFNDIEKEGYCMNWAWYYLEERLKPENRDKTQLEIIGKILNAFNKNLKEVKNSYIQFIRSFSIFQRIYDMISDHYNIHFSLKEIADISTSVFTNK